MATPRKKQVPEVKRAGRSLEAGTGVVHPRTITVDDVSRAVMKEFGGGDFSRGIRDAARLLVKLGKVKTGKKTLPPDDDSDLL